MNILIVGSGGREHAIAWKLKRSPQVEQLYCAPGNAGTARIAQNISLSPLDLVGLLDFSISRDVALTVPGPEGPLVAGIVDHFQAAARGIVGPTRKASLLEASKVFAKEFMVRHGIPTARHTIYSEPEHAEAALKSDTFDFPVVLKANGLAQGKGVFICHDYLEGWKAVDTIMRKRRFGDSGDRLIVEECLEGEETSFMVFSDGKRILSMAPSIDHKALYENNQGPNTGGMGAYSVDSILPAPLHQQILETIIFPTIQGMAQEGRPYQGVLYAGLMLTQEGPKVLEFNARLGDPETQVVLPRMRSDLLDILIPLADSDLEGVNIQWDSQAAVCVTITAEGYPGPYQKGKEISGLEMADEIENTVVFHAGTTQMRDKTVTSGGRVLGVTSRAASLEAAIIRAYEGVNKIHFDGMYYRPDIASRDLSQGERSSGKR